MLHPYFQALLELESSASSDEAVRERIASLPPEVSEVQLLSKLEGNLVTQIKYLMCVLGIINVGQRLLFYFSSIKIK